MEPNPVDAKPVAPVVPAAISPQPVKPSAKPRFTRNKLIVGGGVGMLVLGLVTVGVLALWNRQKLVTIQQQTQTPQGVVGFSAKTTFADMQIEKLNITPKVPEASITGDLSNVVNAKRFVMSDDAKTKLATNGFVVVDPKLGANDPSYLYPANEEFFGMYESGRYNSLPMFITSDSLLHSYHLIFDDVLKSLEQAVFYDRIVAVSKTMFDQSTKDYDTFTAAANTDMQNAAKRNVAYFAVALKLFGQDVTVPDYVKDIVNQEMDLISKTAGIELSPVVNLGAPVNPAEGYKEDYSQYIPRGHYTKTERLKQYFKGMMWFGRITYRQKSVSENLSAILLTQGLKAQPEAYQKWSDVYDATSFMIGNSDDLGVYEYAKVIADNAGATNDTLITEIKKLAPPSINSIPIFDEAINPDREAEIKGFRFMGQRYTLDSDVFQRLVYRDVKAADNNAKRMLPTGLDFVAAMGSDKATELVKTPANLAFPNYASNLDALKAKIGGYAENYWTQNLYSGWLYTLKPFAGTVGAGYPKFMQTTAWQLKDINTFLGSWTELRHDTLLYAKQSLAEMGAGGGSIPVPLDSRGYVEPRPDVYSRLETLARATYEGLTKRNLLQGLDYSYTDKAPGDCPQYVICETTFSIKGDDISANLNNLKDTVAQAKSISVKELENTKLSDAEYQFIAEYGGKLEHMWEATLHRSTPIRPSEKGLLLHDNPVMLVADVAADPNGVALEEGTGYVQEIYVVIPVPGEDNYYRVARGGVWSQYEFTVPLSGRMTDEQWRQQVRDLKQPAQPEWKSGFMAQSSPVKILNVPMSYKNAIDNGWMSLTDAQTDCSQQKGTFNQCGDVCPENNRSCGKACEPVCTFY